MPIKLLCVKKLQDLTKKKNQKVICFLELYFEEKVTDTDKAGVATNEIFIYGDQGTGKSYRWINYTSNLRIFVLF